MIRFFVEMQTVPLQDEGLMQHALAYHRRQHVSVPNSGGTAAFRG